MISSKTVASVQGLIVEVGKDYPEWKTGTFRPPDGRDYVLNRVPGT